MRLRGKASCKFVDGYKREYFATFDCVKIGSILDINKVGCHFLRVFNWAYRRALRLVMFKYERSRE
jgi:hypothetical protein